ncbi:hypothetical protein MPLSOD_260034 [Mesorhizobium sp. SOD10]|nr:hypothetical protein MPLSOD_260034 [Mesorhizobium sp. SOD10]
MTLRLEVRQLPLRDLSGFFPEYSAEQLIETYAIFGGVPYYLTLFDPYASLRENVINLLLKETGTLIDEPNILLQSELREPGIYASIVAAISEGLHSAGDIATRLQMPTTAVGQYIDRLERLHLVSSVRSLDAAEKSRNKRFVLTDRLMGFWHRFVRPNLTAINGGYGTETYDQYIQRRFPEYMRGAFEGVCSGPRSPSSRRGPGQSSPRSRQHLGPCRLRYRCRGPPPRRDVLLRRMQVALG